MSLQSVTTHSTNINHKIEITLYPSLYKILSCIQKGDETRNTFFVELIVKYEEMRLMGKITKTQHKNCKEGSPNL